MSVDHGNTLIRLILRARLATPAAIHWWVKGQIYDNPFIGVFVDTCCNFPPDKPNYLHVSNMDAGLQVALAVIFVRHFFTEFECQEHRCLFCTQRKMGLHRGRTVANQKEVCNSHGIPPVSLNKTTLFALPTAYEELALMKIQTVQDSEQRNAVT